MDELCARISTQKDIQDCTLLCFCETWLGERTPDEAVTLDGYTVFRGDGALGKAERPAEVERPFSSNNPGVWTAGLFPNPVRKT